MITLAGIIHTARQVMDIIQYDDEDRAFIEPEPRDALLRGMELLGYCGESDPRDAFYLQCVDRILDRVVNAPLEDLWGVAFDREFSVNDYQPGILVDLLLEWMEEDDGGYPGAQERTHLLLEWGTRHLSLVEGQLRERGAFRSTDSLVGVISEAQEVYGYQLRRPVIERLLEITPGA